MDQYEVSDENYVSWYTSQIRDTNGNTINIAYKHDANGYTYIDTLSASDGRFVQFTYANEGTSDIILSSIMANGQTWQYHYTDVAGVIGGHKHLTEVVRPDGTRWRYDYYPQLTGVGEAGSWSLSQVTYPYGGTISYAYKPVNFEPGANYPTTVVASKTTGGTGITPGTWLFDYSPAMANESGLDITTVDAPDGTYRYYHFGYSNTYSGAMWTVGLLRGKEIYGKASNLLQQEINDWDYQTISDENYWHGRDTLRVDGETVAPILTKRKIWRDSANYITEYQNYDAYGNPGRIVETGNVLNDQTKTTDITYHIDTGRWILGLPKDETIAGIGTIARTYDPNGNLLSVDKYGVDTTYTYTAAGDVASVTDAKDNTVTYLDYHRGVARQEYHPEGVTLSRTVNDTGTVASQTNGRGYTTHYSYDGLNRLAGIQYPLNANVTITWSAQGKTLTRGAYQEEVQFDGFGRPIQTDRRDTVRGAVITTTQQYDAVGRKAFASYPNSSLGTTYSYDALGRTARTEHPDGAFIGYSYLTANEVTVRNERGYDTTLLYRAYGNPDEKVLLRVESPENIATYIGRNTLGQPTYAWQGENGGLGYQRTYEYDTRYFLVATEEPEIGRTVLGRDAVGNLTSRQVADSGITYYWYDGLNRLTQTDYPNDTPDVQRTYDANGNIESIQNATSTLTFTYDGNDNLTDETLQVGGRAYHIGYEPDWLDFLAAITYPSGRIVRYTPDALGRPTEVAPYAAAIDYHPSGQLHQITYANGQTTDITLTDRLWVDHIQVGGTSPLVELAYGYDAAGNAVAINDLVEPAYNRQMEYDGVDRLTLATGIWGTGAIGYDKLGNITSKTLNGVDTSYAYASNRLDHTTTGGSSTYLAYDGYGNMSGTIAMVLGSPMLTREYTYDDANNLQVAHDYLSGVIHQYAYDGENQRVAQTVGSQETHFMYGRGANLLGEYNAASEVRYGKEYIYLGAHLIASAKENEPPTASAGDDRVVASGSTVVLDGTGSYDRDGTITGYQWTQTDGTPVVLNGADSATASFTAPEAAGGTLVFQLTVTDDKGATISDTIVITLNQAPIANAGADQTIYGEQPVTLDGTGSTDNEGGIASYSWQQTAGPTVSLAGATTATASFTAPQVASRTALTFALTVTDEAGLSATDTVTIWALPVNADEDGLADWWEIQYFGTLDQGPTGDPDGDGLSNLQEFTESTDPVHADPAPAGVTGVSALAGDRAITLSWSPVVAAARYNIYWGTSPGVTKATGTKIAGVSAPYTHAGLINGTAYYYVVAAENNSGEGVASAEVQATPQAPPVWGAPTVIASSESTPGSPHIAMNGDGTAMAVWTQIIDSRSGDNRVYARRYTPALSWQAPVLIEGNNANAERPAVAIDPNGNAIAVWAQYTSRSWHLWANRYTAGVGWGTAVQLPSPTTTDYKDSTPPSIAMDAAGNAFVVWNLVEGVWLSRYTAGQGWGTAELIAATGYRGSVVMTGDGRAVLAWITGQYASSQLLARTYQEGAWSASVVVGTSLTSYELAMNQSGQAVLVWTNGSYNSNPIWSSFYTPGGIWSPPQRADSTSVEERDAAEISVGLDAAGNALLTWLYSYGSGGHTAWANRYSAGSGWGTAASLESDGPHYVGRTRVAVRADGRALAVWPYTEESSTSSYRLRASHFQPGVGWGAPEFVTTTPSAFIYLGLAGNDEGDALAIWQDSFYSPRSIVALRYGAPENQLPVANAGPDQTVVQGTPVTLDGTGSSDPDGSIAGYAWRQVSGPTVTLTNANGPIATFTAPAVTKTTTLTFELTVTDDRGAPASDQVVITVNK